MPEEVFSLGRGRRELIFRNAVQTHYGIGRTIQQRENAATRGFLMWDAINDSRTRPAHSAMDGFIAPVDDPTWKRWTPPAGHNCRCTRISLTEAQARALAYPKADPGVNPGQGWEGDPTEGNEDLVRIVKARQQSCLTTFAAKRRARGLWCDDGPARHLAERVEAAGDDSDNRFVSPFRPTWSTSEAAANVLIVAEERVVKQHAHYAAAKAGSMSASWALIADLFAAADARLVAAIPSGAIMLPVHGMEAAAINRIPAAMAQWLAARAGSTVALGVVQANKVGHTGSSGWHRLSHQALFSGRIEAGRSYMLVDDFVGQGGTLANLRGHVLAQGGQIAGYITLTGKARSAKIALAPDTLRELRATHADLEPWWNTEFGFGFDGLTQSEAEYLLRVDAGTIRTRIAEARSG